MKETSLKLWQACRYDSLRGLYHPFQSQLARGKLPPQYFRQYIQQDLACLQQSIQVYDTAIQQIQPPPQLQQDLNLIIQLQSNQVKLRKDYLQRILNDQEDTLQNTKKIQSSPGLIRFQNFYDQTLQQNKAELLPVLASIIPYQKLNVFVWTQYSGVDYLDAKNEFLQWLDVCDFQGYSMLVEVMESIIDKYQEDNSKDENFFNKLLNIYKQSMELSVQFIDSQTYDKQDKSIGLIAVDFDETCCQGETVTVLMEAIKKAQIQNANTHDKERVEIEFQSKVNGLVRQYQEAQQDLIISLNLPTYTKANGSASYDHEELNKVVKKFTVFDREQNQVVIDTGILSGVSREQIQEHARSTPIKTHCIQTLLKYSQLKNVSLIIISINWSICLIQAALEEANVIPFQGNYDEINVQNFHSEQIPIFTNELEFDSQSGLSTGNVIRRLECAEDKGVLFNKIVKQYHELDTVFVGDSFGDVLGLIQADWGIILGKDAFLLQVCQHVGVDVVPLIFGDQNSMGKLYQVEDWMEIDAFLSWRCSLDVKGSSKTTDQRANIYAKLQY